MSTYWWKSSLNNKKTSIHKTISRIKFGPNNLSNMSDFSRWTFGNSTIWFLIDFEWVRNFMLQIIRLIAPLSKIQIFFLLFEWKGLYLRVFMIMNVIDLIGYKEFTNMFKICLHLSWEKRKFDALYFLSDM
jgi:hypothetical protein